MLRRPLPIVASHAPDAARAVAARPHDDSPTPSPRAGLDGPAREIVVEPLEQPARQPEPAREPVPEREPAPPVREPEKVPA